ncbi:MAG: hypothetical protein LUM44_13295 [Pyrinomonadaceae bacterium]|nr:hypothetical protein [Pyrinomonadaceae bacterium]
MSNDFMLDENLIATLEQSLRQTRNAQQRLITRLNEVEAEANRLRQEIEALENSAAQTESAIYSLLATMRSGKNNWNLPKSMHVDDDYEIPQDIRRPAPRMNQQNNQPNHYNNQQNNQPNHYNNQPNQHNNQQNNQPNYYNNQPPQNNQPNNYRNNNNNPIAYINNARNVPSIGHNIEPISNRFADRTITQACTLLLREAGTSLHVNELFNLLVAGGMEFKGNNPTISIAVSLNRNRRFKKVAPGTFDLVMRSASQAS